MYPTPTTGAGLCGGTGNYQQLQRLTEQGIITDTERKAMAFPGGRLNPDWVEWLMGVPVGWTALDVEVERPAPPADGAFWPEEPDGVPRVAGDIPNRVDRLKSLGNMVVPRQFYPIYHAISEIERGAP
jgi:hypothetical protein